MKNKVDYLQSLTKLDVTLLHDNLINWFYDYVNDPFPQTKEDVIYIMEEIIKSKMLAKRRSNVHGLP